MAVTTHYDLTNLKPYFLNACLYNLNGDKGTNWHNFSVYNDEQMKGLKTYPRSFYKFIR